MTECVGVRERALDLEGDVARDGALEATRAIPRAAAREVGRASGLACATSRRLPRWPSLVDCTLIDMFDAELLEGVWEYGCSMRSLWAGD